MNRCWLTRCGDSGQRHGLKNLGPVSRAKQRITAAVRVRHHAKYISALVANPRDIVERAIRVGFRGDLPLGRAIAEYDAVLLFERGQSLRIAVVIAFHVANRNPQDFSSFAGIAERSVSIFYAQVYELAYVFETCIAHQRAGKQPGFTQDLEPIADANHQPA